MSYEDDKILEAMYLFETISGIYDYPSIPLNALLSVYFKICVECGMSLQDIRETLQDSLVELNNRINAKKIE